MSWWGKLVGGTLGWMLGGPLGAMLGAALGHKFDQGLRGMELRGGWGEGLDPGAQERVQSAFFTATFAVMGHLAKADGRVTRDEIQLAEAVMTHMSLPPAMRQAAIDLFNQGKAAGFPLDDVLEQFRAEVHRRRNLVRVFIEIQVQACLADGVLHPEERRILEHVSDALGFGRVELAQIIQLVGAARDFRSGAATGGPVGRDRLAEAYEVLGVPADASDDEVKRAYRRLMSQHHPDKLVAKGLPEEMMTLAKEKTQEIKSAYETIREARG